LPNRSLTVKKCHKFCDHLIVLIFKVHPPKALKLGNERIEWRG